MITLTTYADCREALRRRELRQALYDEGHHLMSDVIVSLHGDAHIARRRLENRLFHRETVAWFEQQRLPVIFASVFEPALSAGRADIVPLLRTALMWLSLDIAGIDLPSVDAGGRIGIPDAITRLAGLMGRMSRAATVAHATGDKPSIVANGDAALAEFADEFYAPSLARRQRLVSDEQGGRIGPGAAPRDVLTTLLRNEDQLDLSAGTLLREVAYYPWVGSHSTANQVTHALHHILESAGDASPTPAGLTADTESLQRCIHESVRLHPASPVAMRIATGSIVLASGIEVPEGATVTIAVESANRDRAAVGAEPDRFRPGRAMADGVAPWGLSFGHGTHACLGREVAGGLAPGEANDHHIRGTIAALCAALLSAGAALDTDDPPTIDGTTTRAMWGRFPVVFGGAAS